MSEEIDYAEMLEIPVSTVSVERKKRPLFPDLKGQAVGRVNERMESSRERDDTYAGNDFAEELPAQTEDGTSIPPDNIDGESGSATALMEYEEPKKRTHPVLIVEFALACALCLTIFLTNVFLPQSAINTFLRAAISPNTQTTVEKTYQDFTLTSVVSEYADVDMTVADTGVLSFTAKCSVYPACDGSVKSITENNGSYTVVVAHSPSFESVYTGLTTVYYAAGDSVRANVPLAYSNGESQTQVSFYQDGTLLNCYSVDAENCLSWNK